MYSLVLMMTAATAQDVPQGLFFDRGSCSGTRAFVAVEKQPRVRLFASGCGGARFAPLATVEANRPHILARIWAHRPHLMASTGCGGGTAMVAQGCSGAVTVSWGGVTQAAPATTLQEAKFLGERVQRAVVHRMLVKALQSPNLTPAQRATAAATLADQDLYDAAVIKITRDLKRAKAPEGLAFNAGVFGDGHILQLLIDNLPQIIAAIEQIIKLFAMGYITSEQMYAAIDAILVPVRTFLV